MLCDTVHTIQLILPPRNVILYIWCDNEHMMRYCTSDAVMYIWCNAVHMTWYCTYNATLYMWCDTVNMMHQCTYDAILNIWYITVHMMRCCTSDAILHMWCDAVDTVIRYNWCYHCFKNRKHANSSSKIDNKRKYLKVVLT